MSNQSLYEAALAVIPGGVNSPVRAFGSVGGTPRFIQRADGPFVFDAEDKKYIDYVGSWGPMILGHRAPVVIEALEQTLSKGTSFGAPTEAEIDFAKLITDIVPGTDKVRLVNSGTEATMSAVRLARGFTGRDYILKFDGCYHGHADTLLVSAGSGVATNAIPGTPGIPNEFAKFCLSVPYNDLAAVERAIDALGPSKLAAIIVEPVAGNMGLVCPREGFLSGLKELCCREGSLLIFDEVMSGFRVALGGAAERFGITPDLVTLGKVLGAGLPVGAFAGRKDVMDALAPLGNVYQAGTLSGNPLAVAAGLAQLSYLREHNPYPMLEELGAFWANQLQSAAEDAGKAMRTDHLGSMLGLFFTEEEIVDFESVKRCDKELFKRFFHGMLAEGIYLAPSPFEAGFLGTTHTKELISDTAKAAARVLDSV